MNAIMTAGASQVPFQAAERISGVSVSREPEADRSPVDTFEEGASQEAPCKTSTSVKGLISTPLFAELTLLTLPYAMAAFPVTVTACGTIGASLGAFQSARLAAGGGETCTPKERLTKMALTPAAMAFRGALLGAGVALGPTACVGMLTLLSLGTLI